MEFLVTYDKSIKSCEFCYKPFNLFRIRHACKRCGKIICDACSKARFIIVTYDLKEAHKVCPSCDKEHKYQVNFAESMRTSWNTSSIIAKKWLKKCGLEIELQKSFQEDYQSYLKMALSATGSNSFLIIDKDIMQAKCDRSVFNYSMQDFLYHNQEKAKLKIIRENISRVLKAYCAKYPLNGYSHALPYLAVFLLSLMDEESAFYMLGHLVMSVLPKNIYDQTQNGTSVLGFQHEKYILSNLVRDQLMLNAEESKAVNMFLDLDGCALIVPTLINYLNFECLFETWNQIVSDQNVNVARKLIVKIVEGLMPKIKTGSFTDLVSFQQLITRTITIDHVKASQKIVINDEYLRYLDNKFKSEYVFEWLKMEVHLHQTLQKISQFTWEDIQLIKDVYKRSLRQQRRLSFGNTKHYAVTRNSYTPRGSTTGRISVGSQNSLDESLKLSSFQSESHQISLDLEEFANVMFEAFSEDPQNEKFTQIIDFENMYEAFDLDRSGKIGLKEFLFGLFMLSQGSLDDKINAIFHLFDEGEKGYLNHDEYNRFIRSLLQFSLVVNKDEMNPFFNTDLEKFYVKMKRITENKESIKFVDVSNGIFAETFVKSCEMGQKVKKFEDLMTKVSESFHEKPANKGDNLQMSLSEYFSSESTTENLEARLLGTPVNDISVENLCGLLDKFPSVSEYKHEDIRDGGVKSLDCIHKLENQGKPLLLPDPTDWELILRRRSSSGDKISPKEDNADLISDNPLMAIEQEQLNDKPELCDCFNNISKPAEVSLHVTVNEMSQKIVSTPKIEINKEPKTQVPPNYNGKYRVTAQREDLKMENPILSDMKPVIDGLRLQKRSVVTTTSRGETRIGASESCRSCFVTCNIF